jgi:hypothetical protein
MAKPDSPGYRHIDWQFDSSSRLDNMNFSGPLLAWIPTSGRRTNSKAPAM